MAERVAKNLPPTAGVPLHIPKLYGQSQSSSVKAFRVQAFPNGLSILGKIKSDIHIPILTDIHEASPAAPVAEVWSTSLNPRFSFASGRIPSRRRQNRPHRQSEKKAQCLSPWDMGNVAEKSPRGYQQIVLTERGASFGLNNSSGENARAPRPLAKSAIRGL